MPLLTILGGCSDRQHDTEVDMQYVRDIAYEYAGYYNTMVRHHAPEMERQNFLFDMKARQTQLKNYVGKEYAEEFYRAFADSVAIKQ